VRAARRFLIKGLRNPKRMAGEMKPSLRRLFETRPDFLHDARRTRVEQPARLVHVPAVDAHAQLGEAAARELNSQVRITPERRRHPGGDGDLAGSHESVVDHDRAHQITPVGCGTSPEQLHEEHAPALASSPS